jgi:hypothetical protein
MQDIKPIVVVIVILATVALILIFRHQIRARATPESDAADARRFARLLVAEIKLYNDHKAEAACRAGNIYQQLKSEIDRAQKMYDERVASDATVGRDYFYEELVSILADGDPTKIGPGYLKKGI